ncbi:MAG: hypothetical protein J7L17_00330 [Thaumarchaeota archaeon]|nr:hypothetical protein [Nitrososphaerota archaeon]
MRIAVIGHLTIDEIEAGAARYTTMGGVACYASLAARVLGAEVEVISSVGSEFPKSYLAVLEKMGIDISKVEIAGENETTKFRITYSGEERIMKLLSRGREIKLEEDYGDVDGIYLGPVAWELDLESIRRLATRFDKLLLDPQGLMRFVDEDGLVKLRSLDLKLPGLWILRISREESKVLTGESDPKAMLKRLKSLGAEITILTLGREGSIISRGSEEFKVPCYETEAVDPTGAGDVFGGAFLVELLRSGDLKWAAAMASAMTSIVVEDRSFKPLLSGSALNEAMRRAERILDLIERF